MSAQQAEPASLAGRLLLAMPSLSDPNFRNSVVLLCEHGPQGALGLVVNRPLTLKLAEVFRQLQLPAARAEIGERVAFCGGPVEAARGFLVHDEPLRFEDSLGLGGGLAVTASERVLEAIACGRGPARFLLALGYAGWGPGQLEHELAENAWFDAPAPADLVLDVPVADRWQRAAALVGIDLARLSSESGHA